MNSLQRVLTALGQKEPDRVPFFLFTGLRGAKDLGLSIKDYFARPEYVVEGQIRGREKYGTDCVTSFFYGPVDVEAWGGEVVYADDGPPKSGEPFLKDPDKIKFLSPPRPEETPCLKKVLSATAQLKKKFGDEVLIIGVVMSPFSLPVMQMGFDLYLDLLHDGRDLWQRLMAVNEAFTVDWANRQLAAGAHAICYFDPVSSPEMITRDLYRQTAYPVTCRVLKQIKGPVAIHFASARALPIADDIIASGALLAGVSAKEDLRAWKSVTKGKLTLVGNLDGIGMRHWDTGQADAAVKEAIARAGAGGGFILSDNHGEIPWSVPEEVLVAVAEAVKRWGRYPLTWMEEHG